MANQDGHLLAQTRYPLASHAALAAFTIHSAGRALSDQPRPAPPQLRRKHAAGSAPSHPRPYVAASKETLSRGKA